ncbi:carbohydrate kinase family protein [Virgibacillus sp. C22-A2]|uniref:Carbohydrate kinase family protein n=1 Tax=Virgibacillus tibetensis TaxID=3042313 RepID=A0ABU6KJF3_9BACI|nr:carbohydrate kinase family protein [Virgibacillus sp. C22-A2]
MFVTTNFCLTSEKEGVKITFNSKNNHNHIVTSSEINETITSSELENSTLSKEKIAESAASKETQPIICIGGANVDRKLYAKNKIVSGTSNPVQSSRTVGGVARNIAENLGRLGEKVTFLSVGGLDLEWQEIYEASSPFMNLDHVVQLEHRSTGSYTAVLDTDGDLSIALADMDIYEEITPALLEGKSDILKEAKCIVVDLNCPGETINFLCQFTAKHEIPLVVIPVSSPKMDRLPESLSSVSWLIVNKDETESFFKAKLQSYNDWENSVTKWLELGAKNVIVTNGAKGVIVGTETGVIRHYPAVETPLVVDVTGAGDSFCSAIIYSWLKNIKLDSIIKSGLVNAHKTIVSKYTVRKELSEKQIKIDMEEVLNEKIH